MELPQERINVYYKNPNTGEWIFGYYYNNSWWVSHDFSNEETIVDFTPSEWIPDNGINPNI